MNTLPSGLVFEAFNENSENWGDGSRWFARSKDDGFVVVGIVREGKPIVVSIRDGNSHTPAGIIKSYRHLVSENIDGNIELKFANYRTTLLTVEHTNLNFTLYQQLCGKKWAISSYTGSASDKVVVMFKNEQTLDQWALYETDIDLSVPAGVAKRDKLIKSKLSKGYVVGTLLAYSSLIKL
ncbi:MULTISPECIES: hypothetical protein [Shewanella]|uniref:hypothetical protein n=1 Tax=Shewanella TaxID=22 RepID=UPI0021C04CA4|nr:hypothetical protein [Shewanella xiamenensis]MCT8865738.1 hypothetical protein [Shewanella xiamenensis]